MHRTTTQSSNALAPQPPPSPPTHVEFEIDARDTAEWEADVQLYTRDTHERLAQHLMDVAMRDWDLFRTLRALGDDPAARITPSIHAHENRMCVAVQPGDCVCSSHPMRSGVSGFVIRRRLDLEGVQRELAIMCNQFI